MKAAKPVDLRQIPPFLRPIFCPNSPKPAAPNARIPQFSSALRAAIPRKQAKVWQTCINPGLIVATP